uniref:F-box domain-containing protein n=1 Tax=Arundo donax TaxID=35708 RepID=A0A0A8YJC2_ARUDO
MAMDAVRQCVLGCLPVPAVTLDGTLSAVASEDNDGEDRISALPDEILRDVVSRLPIKDAVRTTVLSPRWRRVWHSAPLVLYDAHLFPACEPARAAAIDRILTGHPGPLHTVHLSYFFFGVQERERQLAKWLPLLADGGVEDLVLISQPPPLDMLLPAEILRCAELCRLYLGFWMFPDTSDLPDGAGVFPYLREFVLLNTLIEDRDLDHMLASSPALEMLALVVSYGLPQHFRLRGHNLQCVLFWLSMTVEIAVVDAPRLERLIMWRTCLPSGIDESDDEPRMGIRIACATKLKVLGYLELGVHKLQIGNTVIKADTKASPCSIAPSVKILALKVDFNVFTEVQMLASFLMCFPNIETLHVESSMADEPTRENFTEFFEKLSPIECVRSNIKNVVLHKFWGILNEVVFLKFLTQRANELQKLTLVLSHEALVPVGQDLLSALAIPPWASKECMLLLVGPTVEHGFNFRRASDLSINDPFVSEHDQELFRVFKKGE